MTLTDSSSTPKGAEDMTTSGKKLPANKADFVLAHPPEMGALEIVRRAKRAGMTIAVSYVYAARKAHREGRMARVGHSRAVSAGVESEFLALARRIGTERARTLLDEYERALA